MKNWKLSGKLGADGRSRMPRVWDPEENKYAESTKSQPRTARHPYLLRQAPGNGCLSPPGPSQSPPLNPELERPEAKSLWLHLSFLTRQRH